MSYCEYKIIYIFVVVYICALLGVPYYSTIIIIIYISLMSCVSKLFSSILVNRISAWAENNSIICEEQFGFRRGRRTTDAVFILTSLIQKHILKRKKLYCCFVDLKRAFDSIPISKLWDRLLRLNLNPQIIRFLQSKYSKTRSCIQTNNGYTNFFPVSRGLQQGCNLSPLLFNLYINELPMQTPKKYNSTKPIHFLLTLCR